MAPTAHTPVAVNVELMTRQCAWCWLVMAPSGQYDIRPGRKIKSATHGICPSCKEHVREAQRHPARVAWAALDAVEGDLDHQLGPHVHRPAVALPLQLQQLLGLP